MRWSTLPVYGTPLVGRERDLARVAGLLREAETRLVTLVGVPGSGKTRLAVAAAEHLLPYFEHGACFVDLSAVPDPALVPNTIARALGIDDTGQESVEDALLSVLGGRELLLVLDNFEHLLPAATFLRDLIAARPGATFLATSREPLHLSVEQQFAVPPLDVPHLDALPSPDELEQVPAVALFGARARTVQADWRLTPQNRAAVAELCVRLDGLPLALELAAGWVKLLPPAELLAELNASLDLLVATDRDQPPRHRTLREAIAWSYDLLTPEQQRFFRKLTVFAGGCTLEAVSAVCGDPGTSHADVLSTLALLVDKSLVVSAEQGDGQARFSLLQTIREFGYERLAEAGELEDTLHRHADHFTTFAERLEFELDSPAQAACLDRLAHEHDNLRAALAWCQGTDWPGAVELGLRLGAALWFYWDVRGHVGEGRATLQGLLGRLAATSQSLARARALLSAAWLAYVQADLAATAALVEESLAVCRDRGDHWWEARGLAILSTTIGLYADPTELERAARLAAASIALARPLGDTWSVGFSLFALGLVHQRRGENSQAIAQFGACRDVSRDSGNTFGVACAQYRLGLLAATSGNLDQAIALQQESLTLNAELRNKRVLALSMEALSVLSTQQGDAERAAHLLGAAHAHFEIAGYRLPPILADAHESAAETARARLGGRAFDIAWGRGRSMRTDAAVAYAVGDGSAAGLLPERLPELGAALAGPGSPLSARELAVARLVAAGLTDRQIAARLGISRRTVDGHLRHVFTKIGVPSRAALASWVVRNGLSDDLPLAG